MNFFEEEVIWPPWRKANRKAVEFLRPVQLCIVTLTTIWGLQFFPYCCGRIILNLEIFILVEQWKFVIISLPGSRYLKRKLYIRLGTRRRSGKFQILFPEDAPGILEIFSLNDFVSEVAVIVLSFSQPTSVLVTSERSWIAMKWRLVQNYYRIIWPPSFI